MTGFVLGLAYAAVPGPVNAETVRCGLAGGFRPALLVQTGAMIGDSLWAILGLSGATALSSLAGMTAVLGLFGGGFLLVLAMGTFHSAFASPAQPGGTPDQRGRHFATGAMFSLASPVGLGFWAGLGGGLVMRFDSPSLAELAVVLGSFMSAVVVWAFVLAGSIALGRRYVRLGVFRLVDMATGLVLGWFGVQLLWSTITQASGWIPFQT